MRQLRQAAVNFIFAAIVIFAVPVSSQGQANLKGTVIDEAGKPVENANVWIQTAAKKNGKGYL